MIESRLATQVDVIAYYGHAPGPSLRAYVVLMDGVPIGLIGLARLKNHARLFSEFKPELREHLNCMTILRTIKKAMQLVKDSRVPVVAMSTPDEPRSCSLIERLGFTHWMSASEGEVFRWQR